MTTMGSRARVCNIGLDAQQDRKIASYLCPGPNVSGKANNMELSLGPIPGANEKHLATLCIMKQ